VIEIVSPFPEEALPEAWEWAHEFPASNFDDYGPRSFEQFEAEILSRNEREQRTWGVKHDGRWCGLVGFYSGNQRTGMMRGILFARHVHGQGVARQAVSRILNGLFDDGIEKIGAAYFADNYHVDRFLKNLGGVQEGYLRAQTMRAARPVDMRLVAIFKDGFKCQ